MTTSPVAPSSLVLPYDLAPSVPEMGLVQKLLLDMDFIDLVLWIPNLSWSEIGMCAACIAVWKIVSSEIDRWIMVPVRYRLASGLIALAHVIRPEA